MGPARCADFLGPGTVRDVPQVGCEALEARLSSLIAASSHGIDLHAPLFVRVAFCGEPLTDEHGMARCEDVLGFETGRDVPQVGCGALEREFSSRIPSTSVELILGGSDETLA